ncbi:hypothetical protein FEM48_Zijuj06G0184700 [Ziziphus jujuba var. spinosa]|uniref:Transcription repressor MYB6-like n=1 Tax=Ziziphus jujuba var. spinosa TaxID=714518 RepID=A0A978VAX3_ZIZJJ|nr:hypothetical protein FEM48_Zijuj06G0184700 [Ziziphus jujuba var. spinosa]
MQTHKAHTNKGAWTKEEDQRLIDYIRIHGEGCWRSLPKAAGLLRCGKSCRLRWINYLRPDLKRGNFTEEEDELIIKLHSLLGNKWSLIAGRLPGRTDNEIKNYWNTHIKRKLISRGLDPQTHRPINETTGASITTAVKSSRLDFRDRSSPPALPVSEINLIMKPKTESIEDANFTSSGTTTEEEQEHHDSQIHRAHEPQPNLELTIGLVPFQSESTRSSSSSSLNTAESKLQWTSFPCPSATAMVAAKAVCLCCQLGFQNGEFCRNCCQNPNGFYRFHRPLNP